MGIAERKEREKQQRKNDIIDAAENVFFSKGMENATVDEVAEAAELSKGTLYLYFKSKEEIYLAICMRSLEIMSEIFEKAVKKNMNGLEKLIAIGKAYYKFHREYPDYHNALMYWESNAFDLEKQDSLAWDCDKKGHKGLHILIDAIKEGIADQTMRPDINPEETAMLLWGFSQGIIQLISLKGKHLSKEHDIDLDHLKKTGLDFMVRSIKNMDKDKG